MEFPRNCYRNSYINYKIFDLVLFDKYLKELYELEEAYPELVRDDSPTRKIGGEVLEKFEKVTHDKPMMSLSDVFNEEEIIAFDKRIKKEEIIPSYVCELKIDAAVLSISRTIDASSSDINPFTLSTIVMYCSKV